MSSTLQGFQGLPLHVPPHIPVKVATCTNYVLMYIHDQSSTIYFTPSPWPELSFSAFFAYWKSCLPSEPAESHSPEAVRDALDRVSLSLLQPCIHQHHLCLSVVC